jgi:hypothetical protein
MARAVPVVGACLARMPVPPGADVPSTVVAVSVPAVPFQTAPLAFELTSRCGGADGKR